MSIGIVGGGASGLFCAILCAKAGLKVELYEQNSSCAKKIVASGNGRCNITNTNLSKSDYFSQNLSFIDIALDEFGFYEFSQFCSSLGLLLDIKNDGRVYPLSNDSKSVSTTFINYALHLGVSIHTNTKINDIKSLLKKHKKVVIATGNLAAPQLGGCDDRLRFAKIFGHNIIPPYPMLVGLHLESKNLKKLSGVKLEGELSLFVDGKKTKTILGDVLFSDYGISGFAALDISCYASEALSKNKNLYLGINLLPKLDFQTILDHLMKNSFMSLQDRLHTLLPLKLARYIADEFNSKTDTKTLKQIGDTLQNMKLKLTATHGYKHAEVAGGGVDTKEIDPKTYGSKKQKNLYFCGEVLDITGSRGGFNFAFAWASAYMVAKDITRH